MAEIVPFKTRESRQRVADLAATATKHIEMADLAERVSKHRMEKAQNAALTQLEQAFRKLYDLMDPEVARTRAESVHTKVDLDYGVVRVL